MPDTAAPTTPPSPTPTVQRAAPKWVAEYSPAKRLTSSMTRQAGQAALGLGTTAQTSARVAGGNRRQGERVSECQLPYPVAETHGKDFRDWLADGGTFDKLRALAADAEVVAGLKDTANEAIDDPYRLARMNLEKYAARTGGRTIRYWQDGWWIWKPCRYRMISEGEFGAKLTASIKEEFDRINIEETKHGEAKGSRLARRR